MRLVLSKPKRLLFNTAYAILKWKNKNIDTMISNSLPDIDRVQQIITKKLQSLRFSIQTLTPEAPRLWVKTIRLGFSLKLEVTYVHRDWPRSPRRIDGCKLREVTNCNNTVSFHRLLCSASLINWTLKTKNDLERYFWKEKLPNIQNFIRTKKIPLSPYDERQNLEKTQFLFCNLTKSGN